MAGNPIEREVERVDALGRKLLDAWKSWGDQIQWGPEYNLYYDDVIRFVSFRMETVETCLDLTHLGKVPDSLGLSRSLLENLLLLKLLCAGTKFYRVEELKGTDARSSAATLAKRQAELNERHASGSDLDHLAVESFPGNGKLLLHVFSGFTDSSDPDFKIPAHYFAFQEFRPEVMRLDSSDYFDYDYGPPDEDLVAAEKRFKKESKSQHLYYLSYGGLLRSLALNDLVDEAERLRVEAHYTFLGRFLHPTHDAASGLTVRPNQRSGRTAIGSDLHYSSTAYLLSVLYAVRLAAENVKVVSSLLSAASSRRVADPATGELDRLVREIESSTTYFWLLGPDAPLYDKFNWSVHFATDEELKRWGDYSKAPSSRIKFDMHIYGHLQSTLTGWGNKRVGDYKSPLA